jgi:hypothetical protein
MMGISLKSRITSPSRFALANRKQNSVTNRPIPVTPNSQHRKLLTFCLILVELRHTEGWTRDHLEWFNVDFEPQRFHTIPLVHSQTIPSHSPGTNYDDLLAKVFSLVNEYREYNLSLINLTSVLFQVRSGTVRRCVERAKKDGLKLVLVRR